MTIDSLEDNPFGTFFDPANPKGNCPTAPFTLAPLDPNDPDASIMRCEFIETVTGNFDPNGPNEFINVVTANGPGIDAKEDDAIVTIADVAASIETTKTAIPASLPEPGGTFRFVWQLQNTSPVDDELVESIERLPEIAVATGRQSTIVRFFNGDGEWHDLQLLYVYQCGII